MIPGSPQPPVAQLPFRRRLWVLGPLLTEAVALDCSATVASFDEQEIVQVAPWFAGALWLVAVVWFLGLAALSAVTRGRRGPGAVTLVLTAVVAVLAGTWGIVVQHARSWAELQPTHDGSGAEVRAPDGRALAVFSNGFQDHRFAIAALGSRGAVTTRWDVLTALWPGGATLVRPVGVDPAQFLVVRNGHVALLVRDRTCIVAATLDGAPVVGYRTLEGWVEPPEPVLADGTPVAFLLVEPGDVLRTDDVDTVAAEIASRAATLQSPLGGVPTDDGLVRALDSGHAGIREAAERFVRAGGETMYPNATARLRR